MKKRFSKLSVQKEIRRRIALGESRQAIYDDLMLLYHNNIAISKLVRDAFKSQTKINSVKLKIR